MKPANPNKETVIPNVKLDKKFLSTEQRQAMLGTLQIRLARDVWCMGYPSGITLRGALHRQRVAENLAKRRKEPARKP